MLRALAQGAKMIPFPVKGTDLGCGFNPKPCQGKCIHFLGTPGYIIYLVTIHIFITYFFKIYSKQEQ